jgi:hypothetical protein
MGRIEEDVDENENETGTGSGSILSVAAPDSVYAYTRYISDPVTRLLQVESRPALVSISSENATPVLRCTEIHRTSFEDKQYDRSVELRI